jgi:hypothetical protein
MRGFQLKIRDLQITNMSMLKPQDLLVVLKLVSLPDETTPTFAFLAESLFMSASEVLAAMKRASFCHLLGERPAPASGAGRYRVLAVNLREFLVSGIRYVFPAEAGKPVRGFCTAQDALPLRDRLTRSPNHLPMVWPHPDGDTRGLCVDPLYGSVPDAALRDEALRAWLTLADALRVGDARVRALAAEEISKLVDSRK